MHEDRCFLRSMDNGRFFSRISRGRIWYAKRRDEAYMTYEKRARALAAALARTFGKRFEVVSDERS